jgi:hypothetical protein
VLGARTSVRRCVMDSVMACIGDEVVLVCTCGAAREREGHAGVSTTIRHKQPGEREITLKTTLR